MKQAALVERGQAHGRPFDRAAVDYDRVFEADPTTRRLRKEFYSLIASFVEPGGRLLDLACGTGTDAITLADMGYHVTGVDSSPAMIGLAQEKTRVMEGLPPSLVVGTLEDLPGDIIGPFDLAYSNFGGLNCIPDLTAVSNRLSALVRPGGYLVTVVMPPVSPWEIAAGLAHLRPAHAFRRFAASPVATGRDLPPFPVTYYTPRRLQRAFGAHFEPVLARGMNFLTPPPGSSTAEGRPSSLVAGLHMIERHLGSLPVLRSMGDHCLVVMRRRKAAGRAR